jgi:hypothetical protein
VTNKQNQLTNNDETDEHRCRAALLKGASRTNEQASANGTAAIEWLVSHALVK